MKRVILSGLFFLSAPLALLSAIFFLLIITEGSGSKSQAFFNQTTHVAYAALPPGGNQFEEEIVPQDAKEETLRQFFQKYNSPLADYSKFIIETAKKYNLDHRLLPAIAMQETNLCKKSREGSHNCWGYGVTSGKYRYFNSYEEGIETVTRSLAEKYRDRHGLVTPEEIEKMYTPSSDGTWAYSVEHFMSLL